MVAGDSNTLHQWSQPLTKAEHQDRNQAIFDLWLAGATTTEIAKKVHLARQHIDRLVAKAHSTKAENWCIPEKPPIYNVWNYALCQPGGRNFSTQPGTTK